MQSELLIAIFTGLGAMLGWGFADFFAKKTVDQVGSIVSLVWAHVFGTLVLILFAFYKFQILNQTMSISTDLEVWGLLAFFGALQAIVYLLAYEGFGKGQLSILNPIFASYSGLAAIISIVVFKEVLTLPLAIALVVIFMGVVLLSIESTSFLDKRLNLSHAPGFKEVGLAALFAAFWQVYWDRFLGEGDWLLYTLFMYGFMALTAFIIARVKKVNLQVKKSNLWKFLFLIGFCEVIAYLALSLGFAATRYTSIVIILAGAFSLPTIILAHIFLKERFNKLQAFGAFGIITGIIVLSIF